MKLRYISLVLLLCILFSGCAAAGGNVRNKELPVEAASNLVFVDEVPYAVWLDFDDGPMGLNIHTEASSTDLTYKLKASTGTFDVQKPAFRECVITGGTSAGWMPSSETDASATAYVEVLIQKDEEIVGYALITMNGDEHATWRATLTKCATFTDGNGSVVSVSADEVQNSIELARQKMDN